MNGINKTGNSGLEYIRPLKKKIGGTTYIVTGHFSENARETATDKVRRIILKESENISKRL